MRDMASDAAVIVFGHGSSLKDHSGAPVIQHAAELRRRGLFASVHEAFWKQEPRLPEVLANLTAPRIFLLPFFISEGYFSWDVIPRSLGFAAGEQAKFPLLLARGGQSLIYCRPLGTHPRLSEIILARAKSLVEQFPFPRVPQTRDTTLVIAGHGTPRDPSSRRTIERQVQAISERGLYAAVRPAFIEEEPRIADCCLAASTANVVVIPFFIEDGRHVCEDIPVLLGEPERIVKQRSQAGQPPWRNPTEKKGKRVWYGSSVGSDPLMTEILLDLVREASQALGRERPGEPRMDTDEH